MKHGQSGHHGQGGQHGQPALTSTPSTKSMPSTKSTPSMLSTFPEIAANGILALIAVASSLLDRQLAAQAAAFQRDGGFTECLYHDRRRR